ncbi:MAG: T9SS type A sorting domain-containing protein [Ignavibacteria bacterium]|jgi:glycosidase|nr:T9SS type A sorting domain-containing protein [Ignavibacteria bacterium]MCU7501997.1 T9SS type A sorting domain-containing protein [Ignavibacteria bacterium]MCU7516965.1 T9SS type A sorting domain-containing protein [Ignavibacteria bacterium]
MKVKLILFTLFIFAQTLTAQVVTLYPSFATENDSIRVVFNIQQATRKDLAGYTGDVYTHTGVTVGTSRWQHVIGSWGINSTQPKLKRIAADQYELVIGKPHDFYKAGSSEKITELDFVLRSADASKQTEDIFVKLFEQGLDLTILAPRQFPVFLMPGESTDIKAAASKASTKTLFVNNVQVFQTSNDTLVYSYKPSDTGKKTFRIVAQDNGGATKADSFTVYANAAVSLKDLPPGVKDGINYIDNNTVTLVLYAPYKRFVYVTGDFNNWDINPSYYMNLTPDGKRYWVTIPNLTAGQEYAFQYYIDGKMKVADPYTDKVLDPWNDQYITPDTYPNLKAYPTGKGDNIVSVLQTAQPAYNWTSTTGYVRPDKENLVIYELLVRDFVATHSFKTLSDTLGYFKRLGVNAIELMPVSEFEGNLSWGYNPNFYFAPDKYYGTKNDYKKFIDACHANGIAVIMDIVLNHSFGTNPMVRMYWDETKNAPSALNPWFNQTSPNTAYSWGSDFNHESQATKDFVDRVTSYWITEFKVDGYRFDFSKGFTNTPGDGYAYDASRIAILKRMADKIWTVDPKAYVILEHFADNSEEKVLADYGMMLWGNLNESYNQASMGYLESSDFSWGSYKNRSWSKPGLVTYMESHDEERMMYKDITWGAQSGSYNVKDTSQALNRVKLASAFFFTIPGPKMIWQFEELGYDYSIDFNSRTGNKPIRWDYLKQPRREKLFKVMQALIKLKTNYPAFRSGNYSLSLADLVKKITITDPSMNVAIIGNFDVANRTSGISFPSTGTYYDYFTGNSVNASGTQVSLDLQPGEFHIYTNVKLPAPEGDILNDVEGNEARVEGYELKQNYPNPFNPSTLISYELPHEGRVTLRVYDLMGREVATLVNGFQAKGKYRKEFSGKNLTSGIYFYELRTDDFVSARKMLLLK